MSSSTSILLFGDLLIKGNRSREDLIHVHRGSPTAGNLVNQITQSQLGFRGDLLNVTP